MMTLIILPRRCNHLIIMLYYSSAVKGFHGAQCLVVGLSIMTSSAASKLDQPRKPLVTSRAYLVYYSRGNKISRFRDILFRLA